MLNEVRKKIVDSYVKELEDIMEHTSYHSFQQVNENIDWLANRCLELITNRIGIGMLAEVVDALKEKHPDWK